MHKICFLLFSLSFFAVSAQNITLKKGIVNSDLVTSDSLRVPYTLYIPSEFDPSKAYPALFVFDPEGNGVRTSRMFKAGMIQDNFIIASPNVRLGDSLEADVDNGLRVIEDVLKKIKVNSNYVYTAGLDEGARVASGITFLITNICGVLAVNDIFFKNDPRITYKKEIYLGLVGDTSPKYYDMVNVFDVLSSFKSENMLYEYSGDGGWPDIDYLLSSFNTLHQLQTERVKEELPKQFIDASFVRDYLTADALIKRHEYTIAYDFLSELKDKYRHSHDLDSLRDIQRDLRKMKAFKRERNNKNNGLIDEAYLLDDMSYFIDDDVVTANFENLGYWDEKIQQFETVAQDSTKPYEQKVAKRMLGYIDLTVDRYIEALDSNKAATASQKIFPNVLKTIIKPNYFPAYINIIQLASEDNDENTAYFYLEELLKKGYKDYKKLYSIPGTEVIRITPTYNQIVERYLYKSEYQ